MKLNKIFFAVVVIVLIASCNNKNRTDISSNDKIAKNSYDTAKITNDFYDDVETIDLKFDSLEIAGETKKTGKVDLSKFQLRSVIAKEAILKNDKDTFIGAYRFDGYSIFDILNDRLIIDKDEKIFNSVINYFIEVENAKGDKIVISWGEIYYPAHRHEIILATKVARIIPTKTKDLWSLPTESKIIVGNDIVSERNISNPTKIIIKSFPKDLPNNKGLKPLYCSEIKLFDQNNQIGKISDFPKNLTKEIYPTIFYGRGKGIHGINKFEGVKLREILEKYYIFNKENIQKGLFLIAGIDGFRAVYTYSEIFNRNDQNELLLIEVGKDKDGGRFKCFPSGDYFSDRAIKAISEIDFIVIK